MKANAIIFNVQIDVKIAHLKIKKDSRFHASPLFIVIAGGGFEPPTSGLWARRATRLLYPAIIDKFNSN
jgi:hypothetical protein